MSIEVRCPSPGCGKTHRVKNKYAGKRGQCPDCGAWMMVPQLAMPIEAPAPAPVPAPVPQADFVEGDVWLAEADEEIAEAQLLLPEDDEVPVAEPPRRSGKGKSAERFPAPARKPDRKSRIRDEEADEVEVAELADDEEKPSRSSGKRFSWVAVALVALGALALATVGITPYLEGPSIRGTAGPGASPVRSFNLEWVPEDAVLVVTVVPAGLAFLVLIGLTVAMATKNFGVVPLLSIYPAALGSVALLTLGTFREFAIERAFSNARDVSAAARGARAAIAVPETSLGQAPVVALAAAGLALLLLSIGALMMPRGSLGRLLYTLTMLLACAGGAFFVFAFADLPPALKSLIG